MDLIDALGQRPERRRVFTDELLSEVDDEVLQEVVETAVERLNAPIAVVSLVLDDVQFFKAHHGLPSDIASACSTDREASFCQFVVRDGKSMEVTDAPNDTRLPQKLVREYGIKSYLGIPLRIDDVVVGSLCVIDVKTRSFSDKEKEDLESLAQIVNERIDVLAEGRRRSYIELSDDISLPAVAELRESLSPIYEATEEAIIAQVAIRSYLRLSSLVDGGGECSPELLESNLAAAVAAADQCKNLLCEIQAAAHDIDDCAVALECLTTPAPIPHLSVVLEAAQDLSRRSIRKIGGSRLPDLAHDPQLSIPRPFAVALVTACLTSIGRVVEKCDCKTGISMDCSPVEHGIELILSCDALTDESAEEVLEDVRLHTVEGDPSFRLAVEDRAVHLRFATVSED